MIGSAVFDPFNDILKDTFIEDTIHLCDQITRLMNESLTNPVLIVAVAIVSNFLRVIVSKLVALVVLWRALGICARMNAFRFLVTSAIIAVLGDVSCLTMNLSICLLD